MYCKKYVMNKIKGCVLFIFLYNDINIVIRNGITVCQVFNVIMVLRKKFHSNMNLVKALIIAFKYGFQ
jgi:hypothetical protein